MNVGEMQRLLSLKRKRPVDANRLENLQTLCVPCHARKTELDRQRESRVR